jgi:hypothetical protein
VCHAGRTAPFARLYTQLLVLRYALPFERCAQTRRTPPRWTNGTHADGFVMELLANRHEAVRSAPDLGAFVRRRESMAWRGVGRREARKARHWAFAFDDDDDLQRPQLATTTTTTAAMSRSSRLPGQPMASDERPSSHPTVPPFYPHPPPSAPSYAPAFDSSQYVQRSERTDSLAGHQGARIGAPPAGALRSGDSRRASLGSLFARTVADPGMDVVQGPREQPEYAGYASVFEEYEQSINPGPSSQPPRSPQQQTPYQFPETQYYGNPPPPPPGAAAPVASSSPSFRPSTSPRPQYNVSLAGGRGLRPHESRVVDSEGWETGEVLERYGRRTSDTSVYSDRTVTSPVLPPLPSSDSFYASVTGGQGSTGRPFGCGLPPNPRPQFAGHPPPPPPLPPTTSATTTRPPRDTQPFAYRPIDGSPSAPRPNPLPPRPTTSSYPSSAPPIPTLDRLAPHERVQSLNSNSTLVHSAPPVDAFDQRDLEGRRFAAHAAVRDAASGDWSRRTSHSSVGTLEGRQPSIYATPPAEWEKRGTSMSSTSSDAPSHVTHSTVPTTPTSSASTHKRRTTLSPNTSLSAHPSTSLFRVDSSTSLATFNERGIEGEFVEPALLSHLAVWVKDRVPRGGRFKGVVEYPGSFTGEEIVVSPPIEESERCADEWE